MNLGDLKKLFALTVMLCGVSVYGDAIEVVNHSFEDPVVPFQDPYALPYAAGWIELDVDPTGYSQNTGVFLNVTGIAHADGAQIAFLGGEKGNAFLQDLSATYQVGKSYKLTVGVCVSAQYPPSDPNGLELAFYYTSPTDPNRIDIISAITPEPNNFTSTELEDHSIYLPPVQVDDAWVGKTIGIAMRGTGPLGGYWDLDNIRVTEYPIVPDFNDDSIVNLPDFAKMTFDWLFCDEPLTDVTGEGCVDEDDLMVLISYWLGNV